MRTFDGLQAISFRGSGCAAYEPYSSSSANSEHSEKFLPNTVSIGRAHGWNLLEVTGAAGVVHAAHRLACPKCSANMAGP